MIESSSAALALDAMVLTLVARLAAALLDLTAIDGGVGRSLGCSLGRLTDAPTFKGPLRLAGARLAGLDTLPLGRGFMDRLRSSAASRTCALLVSQPTAAIRDMALLVAAVAFHRSLIGVVLKADRELLRGEVGDEAFTIATQEAVLLYPSLGALGEGEPIWTAGEPGTLRTRLVSAGASVLGRFVALTEPELADAFERRVLASVDHRPGVTVPFDGSHCDHVVRLLRRRGPGWATLIA